MKQLFRTTILSSFFVVLSLTSCAYSQGQNEKNTSTPFPERPNVKLSTQAKEISDHLDKGNMSAAKTLIDSYARICVNDPGYHVQHARYLLRYHKLAVSDKAFYYINEGNKSFPSEKIPVSSDEIIDKCKAAIEFDEEFLPCVMDMLYREIYEQIVETKMNNPIVVFDLLMQYIRQNKGDVPFISSMIDAQIQIEKTEDGEDSIFALLTQGIFIASMVNVEKASGIQAGLSIKNTPLAKKTLDTVAQWHRQLIKLRDGYVANKLWSSAFAITDLYCGEVEIVIQIREEALTNGEKDLLAVFQEVGLGSVLSIEHFESLLDFVIENESVFKNNKDAASALADRFVFLANTYVKGNELEKMGINLPKFLDAMLSIRHQEKFAKVGKIFGGNPFEIRKQFFIEIGRQYQQRQRSQPWAPGSTDQPPSSRSASGRRFPGSE